MPLIRYSLLAGLFLLLAVNALHAQAADEGAVTGIVVEGDAALRPKYDRPVNDALVTAFSDGDLKKRISDQNSDIHQRFTIPPHGRFTIPALRRDDWCFIAYKEGYNSFKPKKLTTVTAKTTVETDPLTLTPLPLTPHPPKRRASSVKAAGADIVLVIYKRPPGPPPTATDYKVVVHVVDVLGRPISNAFVSALEYSPQTHQTKLIDLAKGFTGSTGSFSSGDLSIKAHGQQYILTVSKYGYESWVEVKGWTPVGTSEITLERPLETSETQGIVTTEASHRKVFSGEAGRTIEALPLAGMRSFDLLALLAPGIAKAPETIDRVGPSFAPALGSDGSFVANGLRSRENNFTLDDGDDNDELVGIRRQGFIVPSSLAIEAIQEFQVISALPDARFGRATAGQVNVITKPSVGGFHGTAYGFFTDKALSANNYFDGSTRNLPAQYPVTTLSGVPVLLDGTALAVPNPSPSAAPFSRLQSGATIGFNLHKNYVFLSGEREVLKGKQEEHFAVPTVEQRGMFNAGATGLFVNGTPGFSDTLSGDAIFSLYPFPNDPMGPYGRNTYTAQLPDEGNGLRFSLKADHQFEQSPLWIGIRGNFTRERSVRGATGGGIDSAITPYIKNYGFSVLLGGSGQSQAHTFRFSTNGTVASLDKYSIQASGENANLLLNVTRPGGAIPQVQYVSAASQAGAQILGSLGMGGVTTTLPITGKFGQMVIDGFSPIGADPFSYPQERRNSTDQVSYTGSVGRASSTYSFGAELRRRRVETRIVQDTLPLIRFSGLQSSALSNTSALSTPNGVPDMTKLSGTTLAAMGVPNAVLQTLLDLRPQSAAAPLGFVPVPTLQLNQGSFFFQHERQLHSTLRIVAGLRVDLASVSDVASTSNRVHSVLYNHQQLLDDAQAAESSCGTRCSGLTATIAQAFNANSFAVTPGNRFSLGPRLGAAWTPIPGKPWSIRGGVGVYAGEIQFFAANDARQGFNTFIPLNLTNFSIVSNQGTFLFNLANPLVRQLSSGLNVFSPTVGSLNGITVNPFVLMTQGLFNLSSLGLQPTLPSLALIEPSDRLRNPYSIQYSIGTEIEQHGFSVSLSYVGTRGIKLLRLDTPNGGVDRGAVRLDGASIANSGIPSIRGQLLPPVLQGLSGGSLTLAPTLYESTANSLYNSVQLEVRRHYHRGLQFSTALTYSRANDDSSDVTYLLGAFPLPQDSKNRSEWSRSNFDVPLRFVSSFVWDVMPHQHRRLFRGWQMSGISLIESGQPFTVNSTIDVNQDGNLTDRLNTPSGIVQSSGGNPITVLRLAPGVSRQSLLAPGGQSGSVGRNTFRAPTITNLDLALSRAIELSDNRQIVIRCEGFNILNIPQFGIPQRLLEAPSFGQEVRTTAPARMLQLALKFSF